MVRRFFLAISLCVALMIGAVGIVGAQDEGPVQNADAKAKGYKLYQDEIDAYHLSTADCSSPSLECLVKNTTRFVAIEWVMDIIGPTNTTVSTPAPPAASAPTNSVNSPSRIAAQTGGAIGGLYNMIGGMYAYQPANTSRYVADVMDNAGMVPPAYAQGLGFASLDPILSLWKSFRNVAYFFFIAILIVIGIMIMLRQKISAQASVSAQQALPGIIVSLILVTFSYAIAGLLIDAMYLSMYLIAGLFNTITRGSELGTQMINMNIFELGGLMFTGGWNTINNNGNVITQVITTALGSTGSNPLTDALGYASGLTISIVIAIAVLIGTIKLFFELLKSYASIIMAVVFSPLYLMLGAIPGKNAFSPWLKNLVGNLAAFPTTLLFIIIFKIFTENLNTGESGGFMPPFLIGNGQSGIAGYVLGLAILLALPDIVKSVKKSMGAAEGGFGWATASSAFTNLKSGWTGGSHVPGLRSGLRSVPKILEAQPFGQTEGTRFRLSGKESGLERLLIGTRARRRAAYDRLERQQDLGVTPTKIDEGGLYGFFNNSRSSVTTAGAIALAGAGAAAPAPTPAGAAAPVPAPAPAGAPAAAPTPTPATPRTPRRRTP